MIEFKNVSKRYASDVLAVDDFNLKIEDGEFICFIGTSGSGKTTSMRMINRMIEPSDGEILIDGKNIMDMNPVKLRRQIGYVIQNIGLMPHMTVKENLLMVPKLLKWDQVKLDDTAKRMIKLAELPEEFLDRYPSELSGGQQQRIGVVRALAAEQDIILMDEPFGALDPLTRDTLQVMVKELQEELGKTFVFVTHDMDEALKLATRIVIMSKGKIVQVGTPDEILSNPANEFVAQFIGQDRLIQAQQDTTKVGEIMSKRHVAMIEDKSLTDALELMKEQSVDTLLITDENNVLKGFVDIHMIQRHFNTAINLSDIMSSDMFSLREDALVRESVDLILKRGYSYVPIVNDEGHLKGIVTRATFVNIIYDAIWGEYETLEDVSPENSVEHVDDIEGDGIVIPPAASEKDGGYVL
ncbi:MAG: betaine/proline/choline family ABC transporter ATP-binding protein [Ruoffia tabacinasalis]|uniref:betaine/proline/choline family ABC transporter ATP-binding protein n=1 Tax=unclassified Ruoffia TaxID=2862149 RepID=UPI000ECBCE8D|nr:osmoprotectant [Aerococcaceae bacterium]